MPAKKTVATKKPVVKEPAKKLSGLSVQVFDSKGAKAGTLSLPKEIFGVKINDKLMAQAVRVYLANQRQGNASTKTRGEVAGSTRKIYRQKGTGRARHGGIRAPIFVHGGVAFGPHPHDFSLKLPKKMKKAALFSALSSKLKDGEVKVVSGLLKIEPKTKNMMKVSDAVSDSKKRKMLLVISSPKDENVIRAARNIRGINVLPANLLNTYTVLENKDLVLMKEAIDSIQKTFLGKEVVNE